LPQIYKGFDLQATAIWRAVGGQHREWELDWVSPDGSSVRLLNLRNGYCFGGGAPQNTTDAIKWLASKLDTLMMMNTGKHLLFLGGCDHTAFDPYILQAIEAFANKSESTRLWSLAAQVDVRHSSLEEFFEAVSTTPSIARAASNGNTVAVDSSIFGEMRSQIADLSATLSTRVDQKQVRFVTFCRLSQKTLQQANWRVELALTLIVESFGALAQLILGESQYRVDEDALRYAWRKVIESHAHDSICASGGDQMQRDVSARIADATSLVLQMGSHALAAVLVHAQHTSDDNVLESKVCVFNGLPVERSGYDTHSVIVATIMDSFVIQ
jgi:alpha-mannosidase